MQLEGIRISGYRSFSEEVEFSNLSKINILIGQNNSGKSNVLRFLSRHFGYLGKSSNPMPSVDAVKDKPKKDSNQLLRCAIQVTSAGHVFSEIQKPHSAMVKAALNRNIFKKKNHYWFDFEQLENRSFAPSKEKAVNKIAELGLADHEWQWLYNNFCRMNGASLPEWRQQVYQYLNPAGRIFKDVDLIPATRSLRTFSRQGLTSTDKGFVYEGIYEHGGIGLVEELFRLQNPLLGNEHEQKRFETINAFIKEVTGNDTVELEVPHDKSSVYVNMDGKRLDIGALGSGIEQVLIIAAKSTLFSNQIVCIEEPEINLHPSLQRKLIYYLNDKTSNQYFIATHSNHFLDAVPASIYHLKLIDGYSSVVSAFNDRERFSACADLGYKASDLLQANCIIWVEGPSDRIYLKHWLRTEAPELKEGLHYSIMFYGGRLLSHLSSDDDAVEDFIKIEKLNRNMAIVIDSDRTKSRARLNETKKRIEAEFKRNNQYVWISAGREVENYIPDAVFEAALRKSHGNLGVLPTFGQFEDVTTFWIGNKKTKNTQRDINKIKVAHEVAENPVDFSVLDLRRRIADLAAFIRSANLLNV